ncbi:MAG: ARPP-1 family domain-containing protein [Phycisphaerae bacterium]
MKHAFPALVLLLAALCLAAPAEDQPAANPPAENQPAKDAEPVSYGNYTISKPIQFENLTLYMIQGPDLFEGEKFLTLSEALEQKKLIIHETGNVNELAVENRSDTPVFIGSGEILRGGKQDRMCQYDYVVKPNSGKVPISSFCVESNRWSARTGDASDKFETSTNYAPSARLKTAARSAKDQGEVWQEVRRVQQKASESVGEDVRSKQSSSSLELAMNNKQLAEIRDKFVKVLQDAAEKDKNVVGFAYAINGKLTNVDIYGSSALFKKLWPKLLAAGAVEAISMQKDKKEASVPTPAEIRDKLVAIDKAKAEASKVNEQIQQLESQVDDARMFSTSGQVEGKETTIRRNMVVHEDKPSPSQPQNINAPAQNNNPGLFEEELQPQVEDNTNGPRRPTR